MGERARAESLSPASPFIEIPSETFLSPYLSLGAFHSKERWTRPVASSLGLCKSMRHIHSPRIPEYSAQLLGSWSSPSCAVLMGIIPRALLCGASPGMAVLGEVAEGHHPIAARGIIRALPERRGLPAVRHPNPGIIMPTLRPLPSRASSRCVWPLRVVRKEP